MQSAKSLTTKEVARLCQVSDATVKRWAEAGLLRSERTNGGHRRFRAEEIARFQREIGLGAKQSCGGESALRAGFEERCKKIQPNSDLFRVLIEGREEETAAVLISSFLRGESLQQIFDDQICEAMRYVGDLWFTGEISVTDEHLATRTVLNAIQKLRGVVPAAESNGRLAICCTIEGDLHELPSHLVQILLESAGWEVLNFGANTPLYSLAEEVLTNQPDLVCISAAILPDLERAARDFRDFRARISETNAALLIGGRGFADEIVRQRFAADFYADRFSQVSEFAAAIIEN
jgi:excisionase family DNA binding protein